jgi:hypothetical protein
MIHAVPHTEHSSSWHDSWCHHDINMAHHEHGSSIMNMAHEHGSWHRDSDMIHDVTMTWTWLIITHDSCCTTQRTWVIMIALRIWELLHAAWGTQHLLPCSPRSTEPQPTPVLGNTLCLRIQDFENLRSGLGALSCCQLTWIRVRQEFQLAYDTIWSLFDWQEPYCYHSDIPGSKWSFLILSQIR